LPRLRERKADIPLLIDYFISKFNNIYNTDKTIEAGLTEKLSTLPLFGNIRELRNIIERLIIMTPTDELTVDDLLNLHLDYMDADAENPEQHYDENFEGKSLSEIMEDYEKHVLKHFKARYGRNADISAALRVYPSTVTRKMQQYGIK
jgi:transcriptional regulator with PAS, ATPase and Fis domain